MRYSGIIVAAFLGGASVAQAQPCIGCGPGGSDSWPMPTPTYAPPAPQPYTPPPAPAPPQVAVSPYGQPIGVVVPDGNMGVVVSPDGQPIGVTQPQD